MYRFYSKPGSARATLVGLHENGLLKIAASRCSQGDTFSKKKGAELAESRLSKNKHIAEIPMEECDAKAFIKYASVLSDVVLRTKAVSVK